jgi:sec-independent protein translocase protein TatA
MIPEEKCRMGPLGVPELIFILVLALLIFGPKRLPEIGRTVGKGLAEFRKASTELKRSINTELALDESPAPPPVRTWEAPALTASRSPQPVTAVPAISAISAEPLEPEIPEPLEPLAPETTMPVEATVNEPLEPS